MDKETKNEEEVRINPESILDRLERIFIILINKGVLKNGKEE